MSKDEILFLALVIAFAALITVHVSLCLGLMSRRPRVRGAIGLVVPPMALVWGATDRLWIRLTLWVFFALVYVALRFALR